MAILVAFLDRDGLGADAYWCRLRARVKNVISLYRQEDYFLYCGKYSGSMEPSGITNA